jgi:hypothetical protein
VVPDDIYQVTMINADAHATDITVTAIGWTPALDEAQETAREAAIEELTEENLARGESFSGWQPPVVDEHDPLPEPACADDGTCIAIVAPGDPAPFELDGLSSPPESPEAAPERDRGRSKMAATSGLASTLDVEDLDCATGTPEGYWLVQDRFNACRVNDAWILKPRYPPTASFSIKLRLEERVRLSHKTSGVNRSSKYLTST